jgi:hypothetical protein
MYADALCANTEEPPCAGFPALCDAGCGCRSDDIWVLEDWEGDSGAEVRLSHNIWLMIGICWNNS